MRVLLAAARPPWPPYTGDRARLQMWLDALQDRTEIVLLAPAAHPSATLPPGVIFVPVRRTLRSTVRSFWRILREHLPLHTIFSGTFDWESGIRAAQSSGPFDVVVVLLSRTLVWLAPHLSGSSIILDAIDSLGENLEQRALAAGRPMRFLWRSEARKMARLEREPGGRVDVTITVAEEEQIRFNGRHVTIGMGVELGSVPTDDRSFDVGFWGRLGYFANEDAVKTLVHEVWPRIRRSIPSATLIIAGADAPKWIRRLNGSNGIVIQSPMRDRRSTTRQIRVALFPIHYGSGESMKTLEAAEAGCAVVGTAAAFRALPQLASAGIVTSEASGLADETIALLRNPDARRLAGERLRSVAAGVHTRERSLEAMRALIMERRRAS